MRAVPILIAILALLAGLIAPAGDVRAEPDPIVIDVGRALKQARRDRTVLAPMAGAISAAMEAPVAATIRLGEDEWIRTPNVPVRVSVGGVYGDWTAECTIAFTFQRKSLGDDRYAVQINSMSGGLTAAYEYGKGQVGMEIANFVASPLGSEPSPFVTGDLILRPDCKPGPLSEQETATPALVQQYQRQAIACILATEAMGFYAASPDLPPPPECMELTYLTQAYASRIGLSTETMATLQRCAPAIAGGLGDERLIDPACVLDVEAIGRQVSGGLGLCDLAGRTSASLRILDPNPYAFKAVYTLRHQRADCQTYRVQAFINSAPGPFALESVLPEEDRCLVVEPVEPKLLLYFNSPVREDALEELVRLRTKYSGAAATVPASIVQTSPGALEIVPTSELVPFARYWVEMKTGDDGLKSEAGETLRETDFDADADEFATVTSFYASPFSRHATLPGQGKLHAAVYQVSRDAPLIRDRPTATRLWYEWEVPEKDPERYAISFCGTFEVRSELREEPLYPPKTETVRLPELYTAEDRRMAMDSVNLFNWRPSETEVVLRSPLKIRMSPQLYWSGNDGADDAEPPYIEDDHTVTFEHRKPVRLSIKYGYLAVRAFGDGMTPYEEGLWREHFAAVQRYLWQVMPVAGSSVSNVGAVSLDSLGLERPKSFDSILRAFAEGTAACAALHCLSPSEIRELDMKLLAEKAARAFARRFCNGSHDICVLLIPPTLNNHRSIASANSRGIYAAASILTTTKEFVGGVSESLEADGVGIVHEIGHSFGLNHIPYIEEDDESYKGFRTEGGIFPDIDAVRMALSGETGAFMSSEHGNSQDPNYLAPLMFPTLLGESKQMITNAHYRFLQRSMYGSRTPFERFGNDPGFPSHELDSVGYDEMKDQRLIRSRDGVIDEQNDTHDHVETYLRLGVDPHVAEIGQAGISLNIGFVQTASTAEPAIVSAPAAAEMPAADTYLRESGPGFELRLLGGGQDQVRPFRLRAFDPVAAERAGGPVAVQYVELFVPLPADGVALVERLELYDESGALAWVHQIERLPERLDDLVLTHSGKGLAVATWSPAGKAALRVDFLPDGEEAAVPIGLAVDNGEFRFDPATLNRQGKGRLRLTFTNGLVERSFEHPVDLKSPFIVRAQQDEGEPAQPDIVVTFNRTLDAVLPDFVLEAETGERWPVSADGQDNRLILRPSLRLERCMSYRLVAAGPIRDHTGQTMQGRFERQLDIPGEECARFSSDGARLIQTSGGGKHEFEGQATIMEDGTVRLDFDRLTLFLQFPPGDADATDLVLAGTERGPGRRDLTLSYSADGSRTGNASILRRGGKVSGQFYAVVNGSTFEGSFSVGD